MTLVKICGLTNPKDAVFAAEAGADAAGFVFAPSPRQIDPKRAAAICRLLPTKILKIGVFVSPEPELVHETMQEAGLDLAQIHGRYPLEKWPALAPRAIRALAYGRGLPDEEITAARPLYLLIDAFRPGMEGGTGTTFLWSALAPYRELGVPLLVAGGLTPGNVQAALAAARPAGVDVSSGVEMAPGQKDRKLVKAFIDRVRESDSAQSAAGGGLLDA